MKNLRTMVAIAGAIGILSLSGAVFADTLKTPAALAAEVTGKTITEVTQARQAGKTYGTQAAEAGKQKEFESQMLDIKKAILEQRVQEGRLTQTQADTILKTLEENMANCDGTTPGNSQVGKKMGAGFGGGMGMGQGLRDGSGTGQSMNGGMGGGFGGGRHISQ